MNRQILLSITAATLAAHTLTGQTESETIKIKIAAEKAAQAARSETELALMGTVVKNQPYAGGCDYGNYADAGRPEATFAIKPRMPIYRDSEGRIRRENRKAAVAYLIVDPVGNVS